MQIIAGALVGGVLMFALVAVLVVGALSEPPAGQMLSLIAAGFAAMMFVAHLMIPSVVARQVGVQQNAETSSELSPYQVFQTKLIIGLALLEGAAFFNLVVLIIEHNWWSLAIAGGLVFWMLAMFPTRARVENWVETQTAFRNH